MPSFGDVVLNFASNEISEDNIVDRLKHAGLRFVLFIVYSTPLFLLVFISFFTILVSWSLIF